MLNHNSATVLYHETTSSFLVVPPYLPLPQGDFKEAGDRKVDYIYLLLAHPESYVKTRWKAMTQGVLDIKWFILNTRQIPQSHWCPTPNLSIRIEHFTKDMKGIGIDATIGPYSPPERHLCSSTRIHIRRVFQKDYTLGDYD